MFLGWDNERITSGKAGVRLSLGEKIDALLALRSGRNSAVRRLADDPVGLAQILLLFRVVLADGQVAEPELAAFKKICEREFGVSAQELPALHALLESPKGLMAETQMFFLLKRLDYRERNRLLGMMSEMYTSGTGDPAKAVRLVAMTAKLLQQDAADW